MPAPRSGSLADIAPFAERHSWDGPRDVGLVWTEARDIERVVVRWKEIAPEPSEVHLEYWQSQWPGRRVPKGVASGAGFSGWGHEGDWFNGRWQRADVALRRSGSTWAYAFAPVNDTEFPALADFAATYRRTLKLRLAADGVLPAIDAIEAYTDSIWRTADVVIEWRDAPPIARVAFEAFNGHAADPRWRSASWVDLRMRATGNPDPSSHDRTVVTVRAPERPFSFLIDDLVTGGPLYIADYGVLVSLAEHGATLATFAAQREAKGGKTLYDRIFDEPEQTLARAWDDQPAKKPFYFVIGAEGRRQRFGVNPDGTVFRADGRPYTTRVPGKDTPRLEGDDRQLTWSFGLPPVPPTERVPLRGYLPIMTTAWETGGIRYEETAFATLLDRELAAQPIRGDDAVIALVRLAVTNVSDLARTAPLHLATRSGDAAEQLRIAAAGDGTYLVRNESSRVRAIAECAIGTLREDAGRIDCAMVLQPAERRIITLRLAYFALTDAEADLARAIDFDAALAAAIAYWEGRIAASSHIRTPEPLIDDFYRAHLCHLLINHERHPATQDDPHPCDAARVGSFRYGAFGNESVMQITDLDRRGLHAEAEHGYETFVRYQGTVALPGDFTTKEGVYYGAGGMEAGEYNQHHGWVLWGLGEHYFLTRDRAWLERVAPGIVAACEWIAAQRRRTMRQDERGARVVERGFLPAGTLEDITDWWNWLSTNAYTWWGMDRAAAALADIGHAEAPRLQSEAAAYKADLVAGYTEAMVRAPVVRLGDGTAVPHVPSHQHLRGRSYGWIRETLEGAIHLLRCGIFPPESDLGGWVMKDYEDNLYLSDRFGYTVLDRERLWFSRGGFSMQPNLLCGPLPYLFRDEVKHFVRAFFNSLAVGLHADTRMMTEHPLPEMGDWAGDHYKSSDEANSTYWLRLMFAYERGDDLALGFALPRYWLADGNSVAIERARTYFGETSLRIDSSAASGTIVAHVVPPTRAPPARILLRLRHPTGARMVGATVNGLAWTDVEPARELVVLPAVEQETVVTARYET